MITLQPIGYVHNSCVESMAPELIKQEISEIEIFPAYAGGLQDIEACHYLDIVFSFHRNDTVNLISPTRTGEVRGIFATRSPNRPNHIGVTTVKLIRREGNRLFVEGADALNGSPVIDIKCCDTSLHDQEHIHETIRIDSPRIDIVRLVISNDTKELLLRAAQLHGHICPGLALGVMGATRVMQFVHQQQLDPRDFTLTAEMQNCLVDGMIFVTGCTPGTNRFLLDNKNQPCFYLKNATGQGWKLRLKNSNKSYIDKHIPNAYSPSEKAFAVLALDLNKLFEITRIEY